MELLQTISLLKTLKCGHKIDNMDMIIIESAIDLLEHSDEDIWDDLK